jgi:hypothetical protein
MNRFGGEQGRRFKSGSWIPAALTVVATAALTLAPTVAAGAAPAAKHARGVVQAKPSLPAGSKAVRALVATRAVSGAVALKPRDPAGLQAYATDVSTPHSPLYHHYLAAGAFASRFGPTTATVQAVETDLKASGLRISSVSRNGLLVDFAGTARQAESAFATHLETYRLSSGATGTAATTAATLPASISSSVQAVLGLTEVVKAHPEGDPSLRRHEGSYAKATASAAVSTATSGGPAACSGATRVAKQFGGLTDTQVADMYGLGGMYSAGDTGSGQTVAIFELEPYLRSDIQKFDTCYFGSTKATAMLSRLTTVAVDGGQQTGPGSGEAALDIDNVSALAPGASIDVYEAPNTDFGALDDYNAIVNADTAKVISTSWGFCELALQEVNPGTQQLENTLFEQAAAQGQTMFAAAGDDGSDDCAESGPTKVKPYLSVDDPGSQPFVVSAGGTTTTKASLPPVEKVWNDGAEGGGGGGGISSTWPEPSWQADSKVPGISNQTVIAEAEARAGNDFCETATSTASGCREVPDVTANADEDTGAITIVWDGGFYTIGGTSSSAPLWAGVLTDVNASTWCDGTGGVGFVSPLLYAVASVPSEYKASFTDVTSGDNDALGVDGGLFPATTGYDMASGLGTPLVTGPDDANGLAYYLCQAATTGGVTGSVRPAVTGVSPSVASGSGGTTVTVTGSGFETAGGVSRVTGVQLGSYKVPSGYYTVTSATGITLTSPASTALAGDAGNSPLDGNGTYDVIVTTSDGQSSAPSSASRLTIASPSGTSDAPAVDGIGASGGSQSGGNTVTVYGTNLTGASAVTFGGQPGTDINVLSSDELTVKVPAYTSGTTACATSADAATDVCQAQVQVTTSDGTSALGTIKKPLSGTYTVGPLEIPELPANCDCELAPAPTEYDYLATPHITSITSRPVSVAGTHYASEEGTTVETISGTGFDILGLEWVDVGPPSVADSEDVNYTYVSGTKIEVVLPSQDDTSTVLPESLWVQTLASPNSADLASTTVDPSNSQTALYAPVPDVESVSAGRYDAGPATGGTKVTIKGSGLAATGRVTFITTTGKRIQTTDATIVSNDEVTVKTPAAPAGVAKVQVCDATGCSSISSSLTFTYFAPGDPTVSSISSKQGQAGDVVTVKGKNLGFLEYVFFGTVRTTHFSGSSSSSFSVVVPPGASGATVNVRVETLESLTTKKYPKSPVNGSVTFHYL